MKALVIQRVSKLYDRAEWRIERDDLIQEGVAALLRAKRTFKGESPFVIYAGRVIDNALIDWARLRRRQSSNHTDFIEDLIVDGDDPLADASLENDIITSTARDEWREMLDALRRATGGRELVEYYWFVGSSRVDLQACKLEYSIVSPK